MKQPLIFYPSITKTAKAFIGDCKTEMNLNYSKTFICICIEAEDNFVIKQCRFHYLSTYILITAKAAIKLAANPISWENQTHWDWLSFIREKITQGLVSKKYILTQDQPAHLLTKGFTKMKLQHLSFKLGVFNIFSLPSMRGSVEKYKTNDKRRIEITRKRNNKESRK